MGHDVRQNGDQAFRASFGHLAALSFDSNRFEFELLNPRQSVDWALSRFCLVFTST